MENPSLLHQLAFLYIGFAKVSNNEIPLVEEMAIKRKIAEWLDLSFRNVDQYEMVMREALDWFNSINDENKEDYLLDIATDISGQENMDLVTIKRVLSEIRDIAVSNGKFDQGEKILHDKIAAKMGIDIITTDDDCEPLTSDKEEEKTKEKSNKTKGKKGGIGFKYGNSDKPKKNSKSKK